MMFYLFYVWSSLQKESLKYAQNLFLRLTLEPNVIKLFRHNYADIDITSAQTLYIYTNIDVIYYKKVL